MSIVNNMLVKKYLRLRSIHSQCNSRFNILENCLNMINTDNFDETKFDQIISKFSEPIETNEDNHYVNELQEYLNYAIDLDLEEYVKMIKLINDYYITKSYMKTLLTKEDKINYILLD